MHDDEKDQGKRGKRGEEGGKGRRLADESTPSSLSIPSQSGKKDGGALLALEMGSMARKKRKKKERRTTRDAVEKPHHSLVHRKEGKE